MELYSLTEAPVNDLFDQFPDGLKETNTSCSSARLGNDNQYGEGDSIRQLSVLEGLTNHLICCFKFLGRQQALTMTMCGIGQ